MLNKNSKMLREKCKCMRAGTLLHVSGLKSRLMQCHVEFLVMWRESEVRERGGCLTKQPSHRLNFRSMRLLLIIARIVISMQLKIFLYFINKSRDVMWYNYWRTKKTNH